MSLIAIVLYGLFALIAFAALRPRIAVLLVILVGFSFLPVPRQIMGLFSWDKREAVGLTLLLGILLFDLRTVLRFRLAWIDIPVLIWLLSAPISSLANDHGLYDAGSALMHRGLQWGAPYFVGAMYLRSQKALRECLWAVFIAGLAYVPFCLIEVRLSPQFHYWVYGMQQSVFNQTKRGGGYRPQVFLDHGLQTSLWMATAMVAGAGLWWLLRVRRVRGIHMGWLVAAIAVAWVLSKSSGAIILGCFGLALLALRAPRSVLLVCMVGLLSYPALRLWGGGVMEEQLIDFAGMISADRAQSLEFRFTNEAALLDRFWLKPWFGASPWGFNTFVFGDAGATRGHAVPDSLWIQAVSVNGLIGMSAVVCSLWVPALRGLGLWTEWRRRIAPEAVICGLIVMLYLIDSLVNGFKTPVYVLIAGGLSRVPLLRTVGGSQFKSEHVPGGRCLQPRHAVGAASRIRVLEPRVRPATLPSSWLRSRDSK